MSKKDFLKDSLMSFFIIVTCVNVSAFILGYIFEPTRTFGYEAFLSPIIYGVLGSLPNLLMYSKHELSIKQMIIRKVLQLLSIEVLLLFVAFGSFNKAKPQNDVLFSFCISIFIIFIAVHLISWIVDSRTANELTSALESFQDQFNK